MSEKHERKKKEILSKALQVWKNRPAKERSLSLIAEACAMTKQGLYRYFRNKQEIVDTLNQELFSILEKNFETNLTLISETPILVESLILNTMDFLDQNWDLLMFSLSEGLPFSQGSQGSSHFYKKMEEISGIGCCSWLWFFNVIILCSWKRISLGKSLDEKWVKTLRKKVTNGFASSVVLPEEVFKKINQSCSSLPPMAGEASKITQAFLELVEEKGIINLSLQELAKKAGMGKSSLYNYFDSKEDLQNSIGEYMQNDFLARRSLFLDNFEDIPSRIYGHILFLSHYMKETPAVQVILTEMKNNRFLDHMSSLMPMDTTKLAAPFYAALEKDFMSDDFLTIETQVQMISFCLGAELMIMEDRNSPEERAVRIFSLFTRGLSSVISDPDYTGKDVLL